MIPIQHPTKLITQGNHGKKGLEGCSVYIKIEVYGSVDGTQNGLQYI